MANLTEKQKRFADYYIETANITESAIKAGYSENYSNAQGYKLLENVGIKNYLDEIIKAKDNERIASQDEVLEYLTKVIRGQIDEECVVVENTGDYMSAARKIKKQVAPKDRNKAAELLGKRYGIFTDVIKGDINTRVQIVDDIE